MASQGGKARLRRVGRMKVRPGDPVPLVILPSTAGRAVNLPEEAEDRHLVLFFYPGDGEGLRYPELAGCTLEACGFRDAVPRFRVAGAAVFGVSLQATPRQREFAARERLGFELLSDAGQELVRGFGLPVWISGSRETFVARTTVVVERGGRVARVFEDVVVDGHVEGVLEAVTSLSRTPR